MAQRIEIFDTTLRDGTQGEGVNLSLEDKIRIAHRLDEFGIDYIEGGWPGSNPKDVEFFERMKHEKLKHAKVTAFGSTRHAKNTAPDDPNLQKLIEAGTPVVTIFGKTWDLHVTAALKVDLDTNLEMIRDSVAFLKENVPLVIYDAEHFFDGYTSNPDYALATIQAAVEGGADCVVLCDTNGGSLPFYVEEITGRVVKEIGGAVGFHGHNDSGCAIANAFEALDAGATHVDTSVLGIGERNGITPLGGLIARLYSISPSLVEKYDLPLLRKIDSTVARMVGVDIPFNNYITGITAFTHKAGIHAKAILNNPETYEILDPHAFGLTRYVSIAHRLTGWNAVKNRAEQLGLGLSDQALKAITAHIKVLADEKQLSLDDVDSILRRWANGEQPELSVGQKV